MTRSAVGFNDGKGSRSDSAYHSKGHKKSEHHSRELV